MDTSKKKTEEKSSCFFTPLSEEPQTKKVFSRDFYEEKPPIFSLSDDFKNSFNESKIDILSDLHRRSMENTVCSKIFHQLDDKDLLRASHVSTTWRSIIRHKDIRTHVRMKRYVRKIKTSFYMNKENVLFKEAGAFLGPSSSSITPLSSITNLNFPVTKSLPVDIFLTPSTQSTLRDKFKKCPECQSPSKILQDRVGHCLKCDTDFCIHCFYLRNKHSPTCQVIGGTGVTGSPRKLSSNGNRRFSISNKENKARLKRL